MNMLSRMQAPTPKFFRKLRNIGLILAGISGAIITAPVSLPALVIKVAGYLAVAGAVATTVSQAVVEGEEDAKTEQPFDKW